MIAITAAALIAAPLCVQASDLPGSGLSVEEPSLGNEGLDLSEFSLSTDLDSLASSNGMDGFGSGLDLSLDISNSLDSTAADNFFQTTFGDSYGGITSNLTSVPIPDGINFESLNTQYANLQVDFANSKTELSTDVELPSFDGYSGDSAAAFKATFGDLAESLKISSYSIPSDFDVNSMLSDAVEERESALSSFRGSSTFETVKNNLSYGSVFSDAKSGVSMSELNTKIDSLGIDNISSVMSDVSNIVSGKDAANQNAFNQLRGNKESEYNSNGLSLEKSYKDNVDSLPDSSSIGNSKTEDLSNSLDGYKNSNQKNYDNFVSDNDIENRKSEKNNLWDALKPK